MNKRKSSPQSIYSKNSLSNARFYSKCHYPANYWHQKKSLSLEIEGQKTNQQENTENKEGMSGNSLKQKSAGMKQRHRAFWKPDESVKMDALRKDLRIGNFEDEDRNSERPLRTEMPFLQNLPPLNIPVESLRHKKEKTVDCKGKSEHNRKSRGYTSTVPYLPFIKTNVAIQKNTPDIDVLLREYKIQHQDLIGSRKI